MRLAKGQITQIRNDSVPGLERTLGWSPGEPRPLPRLCRRPPSSRKALLVGTRSSAPILPTSTQCKEDLGARVSGAGLFPAFS